MTDRENIITGLNDIGGFIAGRIGVEQARNFLRTIDDAIAMIKEQEETELCDRCGRRRLKSNREVKEVLESTDKAGGCISENDVNKHYWQHPDADYNYMIP